MDSGNTSGSMQSSSGGDEEYDSRAADSISALLTSTTATTNNNNNNNHHHTQNDVVHHLPNHHHHHHQQQQQQQQSSMFDPLSNFFDPVSSTSRPLNPNPLLNLDMVWPKPVRSDPNSPDLVSFIPSPQPNFLTNNHHHNQLNQTPAAAAARSSSVLAGASSFPAIQIPPEIQTRPLGPSSSSSADRTDAVGAAPNGATRNPKKRSRASRRAPTTVLTTDTTNFRAMVQEFTGIPAPPFTSSPFPRSRLDLFGSASALRSGPLDHHPPPTNPHHHPLLRPFAQKFTTPSSSSPPPQNSLLNINPNNSVLSFHSLLQNTTPKFPIMPKNMVSSSSADDQFGLSHHGNNINVNVNVNASPLGGLPNQQPPTTVTATTTTTAAGTTGNWGSSTEHGIMGSNDNGNSGNNGNNNSNVDEGLFLRSINGGYTSTSTAAATANGHKLNYSASSSTDFHGSKTEINLAARSEGMVESWICSSD